VTESTGSRPNSGHTTQPHATVEWLGGFDEGRRRGAADVLDALTVHVVADVRDILSTALEPVSAGLVAAA
jgi:hypothetical protein